MDWSIDACKKDAIERMDKKDLYFKELMAWTDWDTMTTIVVILGTYVPNGSYAAGYFYINSEDVENGEYLRYEIMDGQVRLSDLLKEVEKARSLLEYLSKSDYR